MFWLRLCLNCIFFVCLSNCQGEVVQRDNAEKNTSDAPAEPPKRGVLGEDEKLKLLAATADAIRSIIAKDQPEKLIRYLNPTGVVLGVDWTISSSVAEEQLRTRTGFLYCILFDTECLRREEHTGWRSIRDILLSAKNVRVEVRTKYYPEQAVLVGFMTILWEGTPSDFSGADTGFPTASFRYLDGEWKLRDAFAPI